MRAALAIALAGSIAACTGARAGEIRDRVVQSGEVQCGASPRAGFAELAGGVRGLAVELCRAIAAAVLGRSGRIDFHLYDLAARPDPVRGFPGDVIFLDQSEVAAGGVAGAVVPGPAVYDEETWLMVPAASPVRRIGDLAGRTICVMIGGPAQPTLEDAADRTGVRFARLGFEEDVEMLDAYNVGRCQAVVGNGPSLAGMRAHPGILRVSSRLLAPPLATRPVLAMIPVGDGAWASLVFWLLRGLMQGDAPASRWAQSGGDGLRLPADQLGLPPDWRAAVAATVGTYSAMRQRSVGAPGMVTAPP